MLHTTVALQFLLEELPVIGVDEDIELIDPTIDNVWRTISDALGVKVT
jgi:hypothetical protein